MTGDEQKRTFETITNSAAETMGLGKRIGAGVKGGEIFALTGQLGTGKTHLIKGIAAGLGEGDPAQVSSPTFVLINEYLRPDCRLDVYHIDAYRIDTIAEFEMLGFDDLCSRDSIVLIEWSDKVRLALTNVDTIDIELSHVEESKRKISIKNIPSYLFGALMG